MNLDRAEKIARTVLYEGYMLYPYRPSSTKNRQRWTFGTLYPEQYREVRCGSERSSVQTQCLFTADSGAAAKPGEEHVPGPVLSISVRCLHLSARRIFAAGQALPEPASGTQSSVKASSGGENAYQEVESLRVGTALHESWEETVECRFDKSATLAELLLAPQLAGFSFPAATRDELLQDSAGRTAGLIRRTQELVEGEVQLSAERLPNANAFRLTVQVRNQTCIPGKDDDRNSALSRSLLSVHTILGIGGGAFVSMLDPPEQLRAAAAECRNVGTYPVLAGEPGESDVVLSSPIILYDHPQIAPESGGDFFDSTEIDELLSLRVMTLTEDEKREMAGADEHVRQVLERAERFGRDQLLKTHGVIRNLRPVSGSEQARLLPEIPKGKDAA